MLKNIEFMDDETRPKGPELNVTQEQRVPGRHLAMIHQHYRGNMHQLREYLAYVESGEKSAADLLKVAEAMPMLENYRRFGNLCGQHCRAIEMHHTIEDQAIFPRLAKENGFAKVVGRLVAEHKIVHALLVRLIEVINVLVRDTSKQNFDNVVEVYDALERVLLSHFGYEEKEIGDALGYYNIQV